MVDILRDAAVVLACVALAGLVLIVPLGGMLRRSFRRANATWRYSQEVGRETTGQSLSTSNPLPRRPIDSKETQR